MTRLRWVLAVTAVLFAAACTSKSTSPEPSSTEPSSSPAAHGSLAECLKEHGVSETAAPAAVLGPPEGVDPGTWQQAMQSCSSLAPGPATP